MFEYSSTRPKPNNIRAFNWCWVSGRRMDLHLRKFFALQPNLQRKKLRNSRGAAEKKAGWVEGRSMDRKGRFVSRKKTNRNEAVDCRLLIADWGRGSVGFVLGLKQIKTNRFSVGKVLGEGEMAGMRCSACVPRPNTSGLRSLALRSLAGQGSRTLGYSAGEAGRVRLPICLRIARRGAKKHPSNLTG